MSRPLRIEFAGALYHLTSRGNARAAIFLSDDDREMFLAALAHVADRLDWVCHAFCLMSNHYHLLIETPQPNLSRGMRQLNGLYTQRFNRRHDRTGHVFQGRFKAIVVDKQAHLLELSRYIVRNPLAAGMVSDVADWPWSSYRATAGEEAAPAFLHLEWLLSQFGHGRKRAQAAYADFVRKGEGGRVWDRLNGPDILGDDEFRSRMQATLQGEMRDVPLRKRLLRHQPLDEIASEGRARSDWMREAYREHGYTMQAIADHAGVHHSTVSRMIKEGDTAARGKS